MGAATSIRAEPLGIPAGEPGAALVAGDADAPRYAEELREPLWLVALTVGGGPLLLAWWVATGRPGSPAIAVLVAAALVVITAFGLRIFSTLRIRVEAGELRFGYASLAGRTETPRGFGRAVLPVAAIASIEARDYSRLQYLVGGGPGKRPGGRWHYTVRFAGRGVAIEANGERYWLASADPDALIAAVERERSELGATAAS
jgi:hypothetical protein